MTMCELVIFGVTCGAQRYDRTVTLLLLNTARAHQNAERPGWLVSFHFLAYCTCSFILTSSPSQHSPSQHSQSALDARVGSRLF